MWLEVAFPRRVNKEAGHIEMHILRFSRLLAKGKPFSDRLCQRILHPRELAKFRDLRSEAAARYLAGSWAAKEAVFKTLDESDQKTFEFNKWYKYSVGKKPSIGTDGAKDVFLLSVSHDNDMLIATVLRQASFAGKS